MDIYSSYGIRITDTEFNSVFDATAKKYREAVDYFIQALLLEQDAFAELGTQFEKLRKMEILTNRTKKNPNPKYDFSEFMYKFPSYYRRAAIAEAIGKVDSYLSNLENWKLNHNGKRPGKPKSGFCYPALYRDNTFIRDSETTAAIKVFIHNTWDWVVVNLRKTDADYIRYHCTLRKECVPTLLKRGKKWHLQFSFKERVKLMDEIPLHERIILAVDLGINSACVCTAMKADGTIVGRKFLQLPAEEDSLQHALNKIKKAQQHGNRKTPVLWAKAKGINDHISVKTAQFIADTAVLYSAFTIVFEHMETSGRKRGRSKRQRIHHWRSQYVQKLVTDKAHRLHMHISTICAWKTSKLAFDGSGEVLRGRDAGFGTNAICKFRNGKIYNCDLSASYNIGARYFIREILKSFSAKERLLIEAKVPQCSKRSTCTLSTLISLHAVLNASA